MHAGQTLRNARTSRGLTQAALARRASTSRAYISRVERGTVVPSLHTFSRLLHAMGLRLAVEPLPHGNVPIEELRRDLNELTPAERVAQTTELSEFASSLAER